MHKKVKAGLQYAVMIIITGLLLWLSFNNIETAEGESKWDFLATVWASANKIFLIASAVVAILSHLVRAERWKLLLDPLGYNTSLQKGFASVMIGYFVNLAIPRGGELSRCYNLYRLNRTPVDVSLGTVVAERAIDLIFLIILLLTALLIQLDELIVFYEAEEVQQIRNRIQGRNLLLFGAGILVFFVACYFIFRFLLKTRGYFVKRHLTKVRSVYRNIKSGIKSVLQLKKSGLFILYSLLIWVFYYFMMYFVMLAFAETENLGLQAALTIFVIGGIAMAIPLPGGAGSFHVLVSTGLILLYGLSPDKSIAFTFIFHGWQTLVIIIVGAISLIWSQSQAKHAYGKNGK
ncbi:MAG: lysylphosphatidylglycerol synthase transmembrane domain-containing protein [Candidatus Cyclobacteriaceae bacterium M2_1C_046]